MIDITQIFFFENDDKNDNKNKLSILARNMLRDEIQNSKMRNYRYLSWRIQTAPLKTKILHRHKNFYVTTLTNESRVLIEKFIEYAVEVFNYSHPSTETTVAATIRVMEEWWDYDHEDYLWDEECREYGIEASGGEVCMLDKNNTAQLQSNQNSLVDS